MSASLCMEHRQIKDIFKTMEYGTNIIKLDKSKKWLAQHEYKFHNLDILSPPDLRPINVSSKALFDKDISVTNFSDEIAEQVSQKIIRMQPTKFSPNDRCKLLNKIAKEVSLNADLFAELVLVTKGVTIKATKNVDIEIMIEYLKFYGSVCNSVEEHEPFQCVLTVIPGQNALCALIFSFAAAFAAGCPKIIMFVEAEMVPVGYLFAELCYKAGIPPANLIPLCSYDRYSVGFTALCKQQYIEKIVYVGEVEGGKTIKYCSAGLPRAVSLLIRSQCSMIVHDDADLKSACDAIAQNSWSHHGQLPWTLSKVFVQESVYPNFIKLIKERIDKLLIDSLLNKMSDLGNVENVKEKYDELVKKVVELGGAMYHPEIAKQGDTNISYALPTILYDAQILDDNDLSPVVTILPYRNIIEAAKLANNTKWGLAASVWSETHSIVQELQQLLNVSLIWINSYGKIKPEIPLTPLKESGLGCFGGVLGLYNFYKDVTELQPYNTYESPGVVTECDEVAIKVQNSKKALQVWSKLSVYKRMNYLLDWIDPLRGLNYNISEFNSLELSITSEPVGVIVIDYINIPIRLIVSALLRGNVVILKSESSHDEFVIPNMPANVITKINSDAYIRSLVVHEDIQAYWYESEVDQRSNRARHIEWRAINNLKQTFIFKTVSEEFAPYVLYRLTTKKKTVMSSAGHSLTS